MRLVTLTIVVVASLIDVLETVGSPDRRCSCVDSLEYRGVCPRNTRAVRSCGPLVPVGGHEICCQENGKTDRKKRSADNEKRKTDEMESSADNERSKTDGKERFADNEKGKTDGNEKSTDNVEKPNKRKTLTLNTPRKKKKESTFKYIYKYGRRFWWIL